MHGDRSRLCISIVNWIKLKKVMNIKQNQYIQAMSSEVPLLTLEQVEELNYVVHGILQQNKKKLDETLSQLIQISSTSILALYRLVTEQWAKKQKIVDNLCHFSLTMMSTVQFLWQQKHTLNERLESAEIVIGNLQRQLDQTIDINELYKQKISEAETHIQSIAEAKQKIEEYVRSQSCIDLSGNIEERLQCFIYKKNSAYEEHDHISEKALQIIRHNSDAITEREVEIQSLRQEKKKLQIQLEEAIEQKQLTKMELQLAEIAIQDALTYKTSFRSLIQSNSSKLDDRPRLESRLQSNIHYYNGEIDCQSLIDDSFQSESKNVLSNEFTCREDIIHFASTPCLLLNESVQKIDLNNSVSSLQEKMPDNPFKKKVFDAMAEPSVEPSKPEEENHEIMNNFYEKQRQQHHEQHNKTFDAKNESIQSSFNENFQPCKYPESAIVDEKRIDEMIKRFKISRSRIQDKEETHESSQISVSPYKIEKSGNNYKKARTNKTKVNDSVNQSSISKFYNFFTKKVVKNRIRIK